MEIDTYRYLLSALIQVFGAIIAVSFVYLTFKYSLNQDKFKSIKGQLWLNLWISLKENRLLGLLNSKNTIEASGNPSEYIMTLDENKFNQTIEDTIEKIKVSIIDNKSKENQKNISKVWIKKHKRHVEILTGVLIIIESNYEKNQRARAFSSRLKYVTIKMMAIPAVLCVLYAITLGLADITNKCNNLPLGAVVSIIFAVIGFYIIIRQVTSIIED